MLKQYRSKDKITAVQYTGDNKNEILTTFPMLYQDQSGFLFNVEDRRKQIMPGQYLGRYLNTNKYCIWSEQDFQTHFEEVIE